MNKPLNPESLALAAQFGGKWGEHPDYPVTDWQGDVSASNTRLGYWDWVVSALEESTRHDLDLGASQ